MNGSTPGDDRDSSSAAKRRECEWDWGDVYDGPWEIGAEAREDGRVAIKSGIYTILTTGEYFDGLGLFADRLQWICDVVNARLHNANVGNKGDGETWEDYAHRLEARIAHQRDEIDSLQALRGYPASKADRRKIARLERLLGQKEAQLAQQHDGLHALRRQLDDA